MRNTTLSSVGTMITVKSFSDPSDLELSLEAAASSADLIHQVAAHADHIFHTFFIVKILC